MPIRRPRQRKLISNRAKPCWIDAAQELHQPRHGFWRLAKANVRDLLKLVWLLLGKLGGEAQVRRREVINIPDNWAVQMVPDNQTGAIRYIRIVRK